jgi:hypothetical protein
MTVIVHALHVDILKQNIKMTAIAQALDFDILKQNIQQ